MLSIFHMLFGHVHFSFGKFLFRSFTHFLIGFVFYNDVNNLLILVYLLINLLLVAWFENIFSHNMDCLFNFFMVFFSVQKVLSLIRSRLFVFCIILGGELKKILLQFISERVLFIFYSIWPYIYIFNPY